ncbi:MAG: vanadium-dependent haloperoxidase [Planctomycetota bacterium]
MPLSFGNPNDPLRRDQALRSRDAATRLASSRPHPKHESNGDELAFSTDEDGRDVNKVPFSFTKGLPHDPETGLIQNIEHFKQFVKAIESGSRRDFRETPLGHEENSGVHPKHHQCTKPKTRQTCPILQQRWNGVERLLKRLRKAGLKNSSPQITKICDPKGLGLRAWESQSAGLAYDLEGPDAQAVTMPPPPAMNEERGTRNKLIGEIAEVYAQALLRDEPFTAFSEDVNSKPSRTAKAVIAALNKIQESIGGFDERVVGYTKDGLPQTLKDKKVFNFHTVFRGQTFGDLAGPYLSQFLLLGNSDINSAPNRMGPDAGEVGYGAQQIGQSTRFALPNVDFMTTWPEWFSAQCATNLTGLEVYADQIKKTAVPYRLIYTPRDLATYVHYDALYQAYLNACLFLLAADDTVIAFNGGTTPRFDPLIPFQEPDRRDHQQGFAHFGGPHILSLVTEVATRALKAVRFQKFNVHRRLRPEALAARFEKTDQLPANIQPAIRQAYSVLQNSGLLELVRRHNRKNNGGTERTVLLPMAFAEGSPMHPTYGAGHATVAGACVTVLKAFFNDKLEFRQARITNIKSSFPRGTGETKLGLYQPPPNKKGAPAPPRLTVGGELDKLAANISIGRDWAGVHYYSDYLESVRLGEEIAIGILEEQKLGFRENFGMSFTTFDGVRVSI